MTRKPAPYMATMIDETGQRIRQQRRRGKDLGWRIVVWDRRNGKQRERTFWGSYEAAVKEVNKGQEQIAATAVPSVPRASSWTLVRWAERWIGEYAWKTPASKHHPGVQRPYSTVANREAVLHTYLLPGLGPSTKINKVQTADLVELIAGLTLLEKDGTRGKRPLSGETKATIATVAKTFFRDAVRAGIIPSSPAQLLPSVWDNTGTSRAALIPSILEVEKLAAALDETWPLPSWARDLSGPNGEGHGDLVRLIAFSGMRWEETAAVPAANVHRRQRIIDVTDTASESGGMREHRQGEGKSKAAMRHLVIIPQVIEVIDRLDAIRRRGLALEPEREARRRARGSKRAPNRPIEDRWQLLASGERGGFIGYSHWRKKLDQARTASGVTYTAHDLRHVCASILIASGEPIEVVREQMGHGSQMVTEKVYRHVFRVDRSELARRIGAKVSILTAAEQAEAESASNREIDDDQW